jgi:hypothetical protein
MYSLSTCWLVAVCSPKRCWKVQANGASPVPSTVPLLLLLVRLNPIAKCKKKNGSRRILCIAISYPTDGIRPTRSTHEIHTAALPGTRCCGSRLVRGGARLEATRCGGRVEECTGDKRCNDACSGGAMRARAQATAASTESAQSASNKI